MALEFMTLDQLIGSAMQDAGSDLFFHQGVAWTTEGGRSCPLGWSDCSQPVFYSKIHDCHDYGGLNGPGHTWCQANCPHGCNKPSWFDDEVLACTEDE